MHQRDQFKPGIVKARQETCRETDDGISGTAQSTKIAYGSNRRVPKKRAYVSETRTVQPPDGVDILPEPARVLRRDAVQKMFERGILSREHLSAAKEIETIWYLLNREDYAASAWREFVDEQRRLPDFAPGLNGRHDKILRLRFYPWIDDLRHRDLAVQFAGRIALYHAPLQPIFSVLIENRGPAQTDKQFKLRKGASQRIVREALARYCRIAGV